jgi:hypothetical protein
MWTVDKSMTIEAQVRRSDMISRIEIKFAQIWTSLDTGYELVNEYAFCPPRRFRADFAHVESRVLVDIQGGVWMKGGSKHSSGVGITRDCEKLFLASSNGYTTFYLTDSMIDKDNLIVIAATIKSRLESRKCVSA